MTQPRKLTIFYTPAAQARVKMIDFGNASGLAQLNTFIGVLNLMCLTGGALSYRGQPELEALHVTVRKRLCVGHSEHDTLCWLLERSSRVEVKIEADNQRPDGLIVRVSFFRKSREEAGWILMRVDPNGIFREHMAAH